jgi:hypothetical protein
MSDDPCPCCGDVDEPNATGDLTGDRWIADDSPLDAALPPDVRSTLGRFLGVESVDTLGEWAAAVRRQVGGGSIAVEDLCLTDEETPHRGTVGDERYHFACFYDAVVLSALSDRPVDIETESPDGTRIAARAAGTDELTVTPDAAVFSFGIDDSVEPPADGGPSLQRAYAAICPYVRAFPDRAAYERWAADVSAATVALPLAAGTDLAEALVQ